MFRRGAGEGKGERGLSEQIRELGQARGCSGPEQPGAGLAEGDEGPSPGRQAVHIHPSVHSFHCRTAAKPAQPGCGEHKRETAAEGEKACCRLQLIREKQTQASLPPLHISSLSRSVAMAFIKFQHFNAQRGNLAHNCRLISCLKRNQVQHF